MRFLLVDDHPLMRAGLVQLIAREFPSAEIAEAGSAAAAAEFLQASPWDLILLDLDLPDRSGLDLLADLRRWSPRARVLVFSGHPEREFGRRVLLGGASGYLMKGTANQVVLEAFRRVLSGKKYISPELASALAEAAGPLEGRAPHEALSVREFEVLRLLGSGCTVSQISDKLGLSVKTASTYRSRILDKLQLTTTGEIIRYAIENKLAATCFLLAL